MDPRLSTRPRLPVRPLNEVVDFVERVSLNVPFGAELYGETPWRDLVPICAIVLRRAPRRIFEFGTFTGSTTRALILNAPPDAELWTLDFDQPSRLAAKGLNRWNRNIDYRIIGKHFRGTREAFQIHQILGNSLEFDTMPFRDTMDLIFVDASHTYRYVSSDTVKAFEMLSPGGVILWHDYPNFGGVRRTLEELPAERRPTRILGTTTAMFVNPAGI